MRTSVRLASAADLQAVAETRAESWVETYRGQVPDAVIAAQATRIPMVVRYLQGLLDDGLSVWLGLADGEVVGHAHATLTEDPQAAQPLELASLYLLRRAQGVGLGRRLLFTAIGNAPCQLWVLTTNERAIRFYRAAGFEPDGVRRVVAPSFDGALEMRMVRGLAD